MAPLLDLDGFLQWLSSTIVPTAVLDPNSNLRVDLALDDLGLFELMLDLHGLVTTQAVIRRDAFKHLETVRDLHLYYLMINSMPNDD